MPNTVAFIFSLYFSELVADLPGARPEDCILKVRKLWKKGANFD
jgi:hypothetical protein